ncbi:MAG: DUF4112 domain-containing protein [Actinomycetota bacterium]|nr:DUF4112 domain-containing protein [Actinomycetota bacterium]
MGLVERRAPSGPRPAPAPRAPGVPPGRRVAIDGGSSAPAVRSRPGQAAHAGDGRTDRDRLRAWAHMLDSSIRIPGTGRSFGIDAVLGVLPGLGDAAGLVLAAVIIADGIRLGAKPATILRMLLNAGVDTTLGSVPLIGTLFDAAYKSNQRNVRLLEQHVLDPDGTAAAAKRSLVTVAIAIVALFVLVLAGAVAIILLVVRALG